MSKALLLFISITTCVCTTRSVLGATATWVGGVDNNWFGSRLNPDGFSYTTNWSANGNYFPQSDDDVVIFQTGTAITIDSSIVGLGNVQASLVGSVVLCASLTMSVPNLDAKSGLQVTNAVNINFGTLTVYDYFSAGSIDCHGELVIAPNSKGSIGVLGQFVVEAPGTVTINNSNPLLPDGITRNPFSVNAADFQNHGRLIRKIGTTLFFETFENDVGTLEVESTAVENSGPAFIKAPGGVILSNSTTVSTSALLLDNDGTLNSIAPGQLSLFIIDPSPMSIKGQFGSAAITPAFAFYDNEQQTMFGPVSTALHIKNGGSSSGNTPTPVLTTTGTAGNPFSYKIPSIANATFTEQLISTPGLGTTFHSGISFSVDTFSGIPTTPGLYEFEITATTPTGDTIELLQIKVSPSTGADTSVPTVASPAVATPSSAEVGVSISFVGYGADVSGDALAENWDFGDGTTGYGASTTHTYTTPGTYNAILTISNGVNLVTSTASVSITGGETSGGGGAGSGSYTASFTGGNFPGISIRAKNYNIFNLFNGLSATDSSGTATAKITIVVVNAGKTITLTSNANSIPYVARINKRTNVATLRGKGFLATSDNSKSMLTLNIGIYLTADQLPKTSRGKPTFIGLSNFSLIIGTVPLSGTVNSHGKVSSP